MIGVASRDLGDHAPLDGLGFERQPVLGDAEAGALGHRHAALGIHAVQLVGEVWSQSVDEAIRQAVQLDAAEFATGLKPYESMIANTFDTSSAGTTVGDTVLVDNEIASDFGAGWTLAGLHVELMPMGGTGRAGGTGIGSSS